MAAATEVVKAGIASGGGGWSATGIEAESPCKHEWTQWKPVSGSSNVRPVRQGAGGPPRTGAYGSWPRSVLRPPSSAPKQRRELAT